MLQLSNVSAHYSDYLMIIFNLCVKPVILDVYHVKHQQRHALLVFLHQIVFSKWINVIAKMDISIMVH